MHYDFTTPPGWRASRPDKEARNVVLRPPEAEGDDAANRAALFLLDPLVPAGTLEEQLDQAVKKSLTGVTIVKQEAPRALPGLPYPALLVAVRVRVPVNTGPAIEMQEEGRLYIMLDAESDRLLVVFTGGRAAMGRHQETLQTFLKSIRPTSSLATGTPFSAFEE
jgi:hypothetical protein